jgi:hypothetical protein
VQAQSSVALQLFGEPKALISRSVQGVASEIAVPDGVVTAKATASGPLSAAIRRIAVAVSSSASSQVIRCQPGLGSPERRCIAERTARGRADAKAKGVKFGRKPTLTAHQQREPRERIAAGETQRSVARTYNVSQATISRGHQRRLSPLIRLARLRPTVPKWLRKTWQS